MSEVFWQRITQPYSYSFPIKKSGLYAISITARCHSAKQINQSGGEDLSIEIDGLKFREIPAFSRPNSNIAASWNGTTLQGATKTIIFILQLQTGQHDLHFLPRRQATIVAEPSVSSLDNPQQVVFSPNIQAEEGDRRPWYAVILVDLPLAAFTVEATARWRKSDSDDIKVIVDGGAKENRTSNWRRSWYWLGNLFKRPERQKHTFNENLRKGAHTIELWADEKPTLHEVSLDLGKVLLKRIPIVDDPKWTGDFSDDTEQILLARLILGEMEGQSKKAKLGAGFTVLNRLRKKRSHWGNSVQEIILKQNQYDAMWNENTSDKVKNPLAHVSAEEWQESYAIAGQVLSGEISDPTLGATHFYSTAEGVGFPVWATEDVLKIKIGITYFYELER